MQLVNILNKTGTPYSVTLTVQGDYFLFLCKFVSFSVLVLLLADVGHVYVEQFLLFHCSFEIRFSCSIKDYTIFSLLDQNSTSNGLQNFEPSFAPVKQSR